jgi:hypothetical protein
MKMRQPPSAAASNDKHTMSKRYRVLLILIIHATTALRFNSFIGGVGVQRQHQDQQQQQRQCATNNNNLARRMPLQLLPSSVHIRRRHNCNRLLHSPIDNYDDGVDSNNNNIMTDDDVIAATTDLQTTSNVMAPSTPTITAVSNTNTTTTTTTTVVGSTKYYEGFFTRSINEEPIERVTGNAILGPTLKFVGIMTIIIAGLTGAFLASNGII